MNEIIETTILRHCVTNISGMSYLQDRILKDPKPVRVFSAPTGAGKSYAFQRAVIKNYLRVLFIVPTRRLAQNLANSMIAELLEQDPDTDLSKKLAVWTSDEGMKIKESGTHTSINTLRVRELLGLEQVEYGDMIIAIPEIVAMMLLKPKIETGTPQITITDFVTQFDHIVFDEFHTIEARGFGLAANIALVASKLANKCRVTYLSATPIEIQLVLEKLGIDEDCISIDSEKIETGTKTETGDARAVHGDVTIRFNLSDSMSDLLELEKDTLMSCLDSGRQVVIIFDSLKKLMQSKESIISSLESLGIRRGECLPINSIDDGIIKSDGKKQIEDPLKFRILLCTSSVEMGVTFNAGVILMDPGFNSLSFIQRIGRVARGDESGTVVVCCENSLNNNNWLRSALQSLKNLDKIEIGEFVDIFAKSTIARFKLHENVRQDNFGAMPNRAVFCSALFWYVMKNTWIAKKRGHYRALKEYEPELVKIIASLVHELNNSDLKSVKNWLRAFMEEVFNLRTIGPSVIVRDIDNTMRPVPYNLYISNSYLISCDSYIDESSGEFVVNLDRSFGEISSQFENKFAKNERSVIVPFSPASVRVPSNKVYKSWLKLMSDYIEDVRSEPNLVEATKIARKLSGMTGIIPLTKDF